MIEWCHKRLEDRRKRVTATWQLPLAADLLAAALRAGATPDMAAMVVGDSFPGLLGERLAKVSRALQLGMTPGEAWDRLSDVPGADRIIRAAVFSAENGTGLAWALERLGDDLRMTRQLEAESAARRMGILGVVPLGLCFLPAFLLTGVAPVVIAITQSMPV